MAYSKTLLLLSLLLAVVLIMSSEVSAWKLAETGHTQVSVELDGKDGFGGHYSHGKGSYGHGKGPYWRGKGRGSYGYGKGKGKGKPPGHGDATEDVEDETEN